MITVSKSIFCVLKQRASGARASDPVPSLQAIELLPVKTAVCATPRKVIQKRSMPTARAFRLFSSAASLPLVGSCGMNNTQPHQKDLVWPSEAVSVCDGREDVRLIRVTRVNGGGHEQISSN